MASEPPSAEPIVVDTMLAGAFFAAQEGDLVQRYRGHVLGHPMVLSFASVMELRYGALKAKWGTKRIKGMEESLAKVSAVVMPDDELVTICARLRVQCQQVGHGLHSKIHDSDRWIAATAIRFGIPLVSDDKIFVGTPGLILRQES